MNLTPAPISFVDVTEADIFYREIMWLAQQRITTGWADGTFRPYGPIKRDAMAAFIYRYAYNK
ncbi:S-layer homology domain-containing protein [Rothia nasimurium]|uniref:S-layer homology domain-containing protein n=1 Tax=Rothia nasimurium TaxID=85336 RepID=UPI002DD6B783|nr:S-layer homology domain-containing protein [Rothia nasimurium]